MTLFSCTSLTKAYFEKILFEDISLGMQDGERCGIIGRNGVGKSSLLRIVAGLEEPDSGTVAINREVRIEYLSQQPLWNVDATALDAVMDGYKSTHGHWEEWELETNARITLGRLGITGMHQNVRTMSGGQRKRVAIARAILADPDLLILDEPTNHLDADSVQWLQDQLQNSAKGLLLVTHDRYFLDAVSTRIIELDQRKLYFYDGSYEKYLERKESMVATQDATEEHQRNKLRQELAWLQKGAKARRTKQKSRIDWIAKMQAEPPRAEQRDIKIEVGSRFLGGRIIDAVEISRSIGDKLLFTGHTWRAQPGDKIGIIGANGAGKSTLLQVLAGRIPPDTGYVTVGDTATIGFFEQEPKDLQENETVLANVRDVAEYIDTGVGRERYISARELCDRFQFTPKQQNAYVHTLSGGERRRLSLLRILMANPNVIFLDEPTNDFDIATLGALEDYLQFFKGVLLVVSHDRAFLDATVDTIWSFEEHGRIREYPGNYSAYLEKREKSGNASAAGQPSSAEQPKVKEADNAQQAARKKLSFNEKREFEELERSIATLESRKQEIEEQLGNSAADYRLIQTLSEELQQTTDAIDTATLRWLELGERA